MREGTGNSSDTHDGLLRSAKHAAAVCTVVGLFVLLALGVAYAIDVLLMVFAGLLFAIFLRTLGDPLAKYTGLGKNWSLAIVVLLMLLLTTAAGWFLFPTLAVQAAELRSTLPASFAQVQERLAGYAWGRWLLDRVPELQQLLPQPQAIASRTAGVVSTAFGVIGVLLVVFFVGIMLAAQASVYRQGALALTPPSRRRRASEVLDEIGSALKWWLIAKIAAMGIVGLMTWLGLWLLGIELAMSLAVIAAFLAFIPNFGPIIAAVPAVLLALMQGPTTALWVVLLFIAIQLIESYAVTPWIQYRALSLPPALTITAQLVIGAWTGILGLAMATPLLAVAIVLVRMLYVEDILQEGSPTPASAE